MLIHCLNITQLTAKKKNAYISQCSQTAYCTSLAFCNTHPVPKHIALSSSGSQMRLMALIDACLDPLVCGCQLHGLLSFSFSWQVAHCLDELPDFSYLEQLKPGQLEKVDAVDDESLMSGYQAGSQFLSVSPQLFSYLHVWMPFLRFPYALSDPINRRIQSEDNVELTVKLTWSSRFAVSCFIRTCRYAWSRSI